jgi:hypothetical protein
LRGDHTLGLLGGDRIGSFIEAGHDPALASYDVIETEGTSAYDG